MRLRRHASRAYMAGRPLILHSCLRPGLQIDRPACSGSMESPRKPRTRDVAVGARRLPGFANGVSDARYGRAQLTSFPRSGGARTQSQSPIDRHNNTPSASSGRTYQHDWGQRRTLRADGVQSVSIKWATRPEDCDLDAPTSSSPAKPRGRQRDCSLARSASCEADNDMSRGRTNVPTRLERVREPKRSCAQLDASATKSALA